MRYKLVPSESHGSCLKCALYNNQKHNLCGKYTPGLRHPHCIEVSNSSGHLTYREYIAINPQLNKQIKVL